MRAQRSLIFTLFLILLGACASSPPVRFYAFDTMTAEFEAQHEATIIGVGPLSFPEYLKRPQIVTRLASSELKVADFDRWAEPLDAAFRRTLTANVDALLSNALVIEFPFGGGRIEPDFRLTAQVVRFDVGADQIAVLDVRWGISIDEGEQVSALRRSQYHADADGNDYGSIVEALQQVLEAFSRDVASALQHSALPPKVGRRPVR